MFRLESDFTDYYDHCFNSEATRVYKRFRNCGKDRAENLRYLNYQGVKTVEFGSISKFCSKRNSKFVVYTNPSLHDFHGKHIYSFNETQSQYANCLVTKFLEKSNGYTLKYLHIGKKRFRLLFHNPYFKDTLAEGECIYIEQLREQYNYAIGIPIYSIDYISNGCEMLAIDFNEAPRLDTLGIDKWLTPEEVVMEIRDAMIAYKA